MEMMIIALTVLIAFAAVLIPLIRNHGSTDDTAEFDDGSAVGANRAARHSHSAEDDAAIAPIGAGPATPVVDTRGSPAPGRGADEVELEIQRYRAAVRAGTVCRGCGQANPAGSVFCFECGGRLPGADAREFE